MQHNSQSIVDDNATVAEDQQVLGSEQNELNLAQAAYNAKCSKGLGNTSCASLEARVQNDTTRVSATESSMFGVEKYVVTSTTPEATWANCRVVDGGLVEFVTELRQRPGADIGLHGSIALTQSLLEQGLVDELRLVIAPALQMTGRKLFDKGLSTRLTLTRNVTSPSGCNFSPFFDD